MLCLSLLIQTWQRLCRKCNLPLVKRTEKRPRRSWFQIGFHFVPPYLLHYVFIFILQNIYQRVLNDKDETVIFHMFCYRIVRCGSVYFDLIKLNSLGSFVKVVYSYCRLSLELSSIMRAILFGFSNKWGARDPSPI